MQVVYGAMLPSSLIVYFRLRKRKHKITAHDNNNTNIYWNSFNLFRIKVEGNPIKSLRRKGWDFQFLILFDTLFTPRTPNLSFWTLGLPVRGAHSSSEAKLVVTLELVVFVEEEVAVARVGDRQGGELEAALPVWPPGAGIDAVWTRVLLAF